MTPAAIASLGLIGFLAVATPAAAQAQPAPAAPTRPEPAAPATPAAARPDGRPADGRATEARPAAPERAAQPRRRRPSYAACNRASQRRSLKGGARRRFLIRCRLGYERIQPGQPARARP
ncbi:hypothetical protein VQ02_16360 [Methylobacterium variabile]|uniref:Serine/threonine protein kinase n=1 Tax=Methylobacterium variabile TaxID=298794 RepID=A0A0J6VAH9_9HYPH|nr:hypothetical protein [Methylobacterium variabile]KMO36001.1 hypothetical protein VQ02_16360 [Methylobacterium variabile]